MAPLLLAASTTAVVWLTIGLVTTVAVIAMLVALIRHVLLIGRAVGRLNDEVTPITSEMNAIRSSTQARIGATRRPPSPRP